MGWRRAGFGRGGAEYRLPVDQLELDRVEHGHRPRCLAFEVLAQRDVQACVVGPAAGLAGAGAFTHQAHGFGRIAAAAQPDQRRHARIVPAVDDFFLDQLPAACVCW